jgi:hypothetical protein
LKNLKLTVKYISETYIGASVTLRRVTSLKGVLVTDSHSILARWRNSFSQLLNVHGVTDLRQTGIYTAELLVIEASACEVQMAIGKLKKKSSGID